MGLSAGRPIRREGGGGGVVGLGACRRRNTVCLNPAFKPGKSWPTCSPICQHPS